jgi:hypothetical protein
MKTNFRHKVMSMAHEIKRATNKAFAICLTKAWQLYRLSKRLHHEVVMFAYEKADGSLRKAKGTLMDTDNLIKGTGEENNKTLRYYDMDAQGFRSFRVENLIAIY